MKWYLKVWKEAFNFKGRARRKEYWMFVLFNFLISIVLQIVDSTANTTYKITDAYDEYGLGASMEMGIIGMIYSLAVIIPSLAVGYRRLHDINKPGYLLLFMIFSPILAVIFIPISMALSGILMLGLVVYAVIMLIWFCTEGTYGPNKYGPDPKNENAAMEEFGGVFESKE